jgi:putative hemolysin
MMPGWLLLACLVMGSFLISGSETALFALTAQDRRAFRASCGRFQRLAARMMDRPRRVLVTVLIVNTAINVAIFAISYLQSSALAPEETPSGLVGAVGAVVTLLAVIVFGEILPKALALANARRVAPAIAPFIRGLQIVTAPVALVLDGLIVEPIARLVAPTIPQQPQVSSRELSQLVELSARQGIISSRELDMLQTVVALPEIGVRAVMVPRVRIRALSRHTPRAEVEAFFAQTGLAKVPVYGDDLDDVRGMLYARDFHLRSSEGLDRLVRPVVYVPNVINLLQLVRYFRREGVQIALVVDEYGGVDGLVSLQDVLEEIVGDLDPGPAPRAPEVTRIDERSYRVPGSLSIRPWRPWLGIGNQFGEVETLGGMVVARLGRLPVAGDVVRFGNLEMRVERMEGRRVAVLRLFADEVPREVLDR